MASSIWTRVALSLSARDSLAGWRERFGETLAVIRPFLVPCTGERVNGYPCPLTGIRLQVREKQGGYMAFPSGEQAEDTDDLELKWDDVQAWRLDEDRIVDGLCGALCLERKQGPCGQIGVCRKSGQARPVYLALSIDTAEVVDAARRVNANGTYGCFMTAGRHAGVCELLKSKDVAEVVLADVVTHEGGLFTGDCGQACAQAVGDLSVRELKQHVDSRLDTLGRAFARPGGPVHASGFREGYRISKRGVKKTRFNNESFTMTTWRCHCKGREFDLPDVVGSALLVELLRCPDKSFGAEELLSRLGGEAAVIGDKRDLEWMGGKDEDGAEDVCGTVRSQVADRQERWDAKTVREVAGKIRQLNIDIAECGDGPGTESERAALEEELEQLNGELLRNTKFGAGGMPVPKAFEGDRAKAGNLVGKHMNKVIAQLKEIDEGLWEHLSNKAVLKCGQTCQYSKQNGYAWQID